jgi:hypothetical protein
MSKSPESVTPANLRQPCPALASIDAGDGATVFRWISQTVHDYQVCSDRVDELIEAQRP